MAVRAFGTEERVPGSLPGGEERNTGSIFGQQARTTELLPERNGIVMCSCSVDEELTRKICVLSETRNVTNCGGLTFGTEEGVPGSLPGREEHRTPTLDSRKGPQSYYLKKMTLSCVHAV